MSSAVATATITGRSRPRIRPCSVSATRVKSCSRHQEISSGNSRRHSSRTSRNPASAASETAPATMAFATPLPATSGSTATLRRVAVFPS